MNIYVYKLTRRGCPSFWTCWAVRSDTEWEAAQWHNWIDAPEHDSARLIKTIKVEG